MSTNDLYLSVPRLGISHRRSSEGYLNANDMLSNYEQRTREMYSDDEKVDEQQDIRRRRGTNPSIFEGHFMDVLRKNYELASVIADIDDHKEEKESNKKYHSMVRGGPQLRTSSPRPLILQHASKWRNEESSSISSADSAIDDFAVASDKTKWKWIRKEARDFMDDVIDAFESGSTPDEQSVSHENEKLSAVQLRKDLKRFYTAVHPYLEVLSAFYDIIMWKNPLSTLLLVLVIVYSLYRGWLISLILILLLVQLSINYLNTVKKINLEWMFLPKKAVVLPKFDISGAQLIFDIAKLAQKLLRFAANLLEKMESLLMWKNIRVSRVFYGLLIYWFAWSVLFSAGTCIGWTVLAIGIRIFFTAYLFEKFPRLRRRIDTYGYFYRNLPLRSVTTPRSQPNTSRSDKHGDHEDRCNTPNNGKCGLSAFMGEKFESRLGSNFNLDQGAAVNLLLGPHHHKQRINSPTMALYDSSPHLDDPSLDSPIQSLPLSADTKSLSGLHMSQLVPAQDLVTSASSTRLFTEPTTSRTVNTKSSSIEEDEEDENEHLSMCADPIIDNVIAFRSCVMNEREKIFPMGITSGILYLTENALVFRSRHMNDQKDQMMMLFHDLKNIKKIQSLRSMSLITGTRKSLEVTLEGRRKPLHFIGLAKRDDFVTRIQLMCRNAGAVVEFSE